MSFQLGSYASQDESVGSMETCIAKLEHGCPVFSYCSMTARVPFLGSRQQLSKVNIDDIHVGPSEFKPVSSVQNLGEWFDNSTSMNVHVGKVCSKVFRGLYNIRLIRKLLSEDAIKALTHAFVTSHVEYCNSVLYDISQYHIGRLQRVLNAAVCITCRVAQFAHITPTLMYLH